MIVDIVVLVVLVVSVLIALIRGLIRETLTIVGVVGGLAAAYYGGPILSPIMQGWMGVTPGEEDPAKLFDIIPFNLVADALSYGLIFIVVVVILSLISHLLAESAKSLGLGIFDKILGGVFGLVRGALLVALMYLPFYLLLDDETKKSWMGDSASYAYLEQSAEVLAGYIPEDTVNQLEEDAQSLKDNVKQEDGIEGVIKGLAKETDEKAGEIKQKLDQMIEDKFQQQDGTPSDAETAPEAEPEE